MCLKSLIEKVWKIEADTSGGYILFLAILTTALLLLPGLASFYFVGIIMRIILK